MDEQIKAFSSRKFCCIYYYALTQTIGGAPHSIHWWNSLNSPILVNSPTKIQGILMNISRDFPHNTL